jgi:hypothetical protein
MSGDNVAVSLLQGVTVDKAVAGAIDAGLQEDGSVRESVRFMSACERSCS